MVRRRILDYRTNDGSRYFAELPETIFFDQLKAHAERLDGLVVTNFLTDWITEVWLDFEFNEHRFTINNQFGEYWFFVDDPECPGEFLNIVYDHFRSILSPMKRIAYFGGTFDPIHSGHLTIGSTLTDVFHLDRFVFLPAFHAPHKPERPPTSAFHRYAMLCLATQNHPNMSVSTLELETGERRYTIDTLPLLHEIHPDTELFFVMGADSWIEITTWREWERVLLEANHIVVSRPGYEISTGHVTDEVRKQVIDVRGDRATSVGQDDNNNKFIYLTDVVEFDVSATALRDDLKDGDLERKDDIPAEVAKYIEKYELYI